MKKIKNKGFTLVELLAVIVILAVVILIAVTAVIPRMNTAKKKALVDEALLYAKSAKEAFVVDGDTGNGTRCYNVSYLNEDYVKKSSDDYSGVVVVDNSGGTVTYQVNLTNGKFYLVGNNDATLSNVTDTKPSGFATSCANYNPAVTGATDTLGYKLVMNEGASTLQGNIDKINQRTSTVNFNAVETDASKSGLYAAEDDDGGTFYYRGAVDNNWVEFGGFYWRIIRINGDGSIRMIYSGTSSSSHTGTDAQIKNSANSSTSLFGDLTYFNEQSTDIVDPTSSTITTRYANGRYGNTYVGYMYNPSRTILSFPSENLSGTYNLSKFPIFTNINNSLNYYFFKNFDKDLDCNTGTGNDESGTCTLKCKKLGEDCVSSNWNTLATTSGNYSSTADGVSGVRYVYTGDYKYTCWGYGTAVTKSIGGGTSVYISCPIVSEIVGTVNSQATKAAVKYHGLFSPSIEAANSNVRESNAKIEIERWYENNIRNKKDSDASNAKNLEEYIIDEIFCNDRSSETNSFPIANDGTSYVYGPYARNYPLNKPSFKCINKRNDGFSLGGTSSTVSARGVGNGLLKYPVGLITIDEAAYAGGKFNTENTAFYLHTGNAFWTMSPYIFNASSAYGLLWYVQPTGKFNTSYPVNGLGVRPVINLSPNVKYSSGNGIEGNPYKVTI